MSGIDVGRTKIFIYLMSGGFAAIAGFLLSGRVISGQPILGSGGFCCNRSARSSLAGPASSAARAASCGRFLASCHRLHGQWPQSPGHRTFLNSHRGRDHYCFGVDQFTAPATRLEEIQYRRPRRVGGRRKDGVSNALETGPKQAFRSARLAIAGAACGDVDSGRAGAQQKEIAVMLPAAGDPYFKLKASGYLERAKSSATTSRSTTLAAMAICRPGHANRGRDPKASLGHRSRSREFGRHRPRGRKGDCGRHSGYQRRYRDAQRQGYGLRRRALVCDDGVACELCGRPSRR